MPEVSLVAIFDADRQGFLRNERSLLQTIGRAARNINGHVLLYGDSISPAMRAAIQQTLERRERQQAYNDEHGIIPKTIVKALPEMNSNIDDLISGTSTSMDGTRRLVAKKGGRKDGDWAKNLNIGAGSWAAGAGQDGTRGENSNSSIEKSNTQLTYDEPDDVVSGLEPSQIQDLLTELRSAMKVAAKNLDFEEAARLRDRVFELEQRL